MATSSVKADQKQVAIEQLDLLVELIDEGQRRAAVVFPPASDVRQLKGQPVPAKRVAFEAAELSEIDTRSIEAEFDRVYLQYERYKDAPTFLSRLSLLARLSGKSDLALVLAEKSARLSDLPELKFRLAEAKLPTSEAEATAILGALSNEAYVPAYLRLVELALLREEWQKAEHLIADLLNLDYQDWRIHLVAGAVALKRGRYAQSIHHFRVAQEDRPRSAAISLNIAIAQYALGNIKQAIKAARRAVALSPFKESALAFLADVLIHERLSATSTLIEYFERFLGQRPESSAIAERAANLYLLADTARHGIAVLRTLQRKHPTPALLNNVGVLYWSVRDLRVAQQYFIDAIEKLPADSPHLLLVVANAVTVLLEAGEFQLVEQVAAPIINEHQIKEAVSDRELARIFGARTEALFRQRKYEHATSLIEEALRHEAMQPRLKAMLTSQLVCYYALVEGDFESALNYASQELDASRVLEEDAIENTALNNLIYALIELDMLGDARKLLVELRTDLPNSAIVFATRGLYQLRIGAIARGEANYRKAISLASNPAIQASLRQKLNLELAKYWIALDRAKALRYARGAQKVKASDTGWDHKRMRTEIKELIQELSLQG